MHAAASPAALAAPTSPAGMLNSISQPSAWQLGGARRARPAPRSPLSWRLQGRLRSAGSNGACRSQKGPAGAPDAIPPPAAGAATAGEWPLLV
jgi:hypothetical protein